MILDELLKVSDQQSLTKAAISEKVIDLQQNRDIGAGEPIYFFFHVDAELTTASTTTTFSIVTADDDKLTTNAVDIGSRTVASAGSKLGANTTFYIRVDPQVASIGHRYLGVKYPAITAGKISCDVTLDMQDGLKFYPTALKI
jgi:hypothetical protein